MNFSTYKKLDIIFGWLAFIVAAVVYLMTIEPTVSFWDCGEFISSSYKLEVGHPPGAPFFMILARFFSLFASGPEQVALMVNSVSAIMSALTIAFLYWTIAYFARRMIVKENTITTGNAVAIIAASFVGAMAYTFSDTFWFSAVEGEVYATSSLFTALVFWAILKWNNNIDSPHSLRWVILIALLVGLSIGVHLLNLLAIPAMVFVYYFSKYKPKFLGIVISLLISLFIIASIMWGIIPGVAIVASKFELLYVNGFGLPYNSGVLVWAIITVICLGLSIYFTQMNYRQIWAFIFSALGLILVGVPFMSGSIFISIVLVLAIGAGVFLIAKKKPAFLNLIMTSVTMIIVGYSVFAMIVIRSSANPPMDQNNPENVFNLLYYLNREQYGDRPLFYGEYYYAEPERDSDGQPVYKEGNPVYAQHNGRYDIVDYKPIPVYQGEDCTVFPRMYSSSDDHIGAYESWGGLREGQKPEFANNLKFFFNYQVGWMYIRYFMWNFAGRQNDIQGHGNVIHGNWKSGIDFLDTPRLGDQNKLPDYLKNNKANNSYYLLPLLLGIMGLIVQFSKNKKDGWIVTFLFILTGLAIVVYLNQTPYQPRERDYAYAGSFYAFSIWIGLGVIFLYDLLKRFLPAIAGAALAFLVCAPVPALMAKENWDDHDRSNRFIAHDFAANYLNSCEKNAILFTYGDNDTFPIWYAQEVEGIRTDIKVCCLPYFASDWYIDQMKMASYESGPMPLRMTRDLYEPGTRDIVYSEKVIFGVQEKNDYISLDSLLNYISNKKTGVLENDGKEYYLYHKNKIFMRVDSAKVVENGQMKPPYDTLFDPIIKWDLKRSYLFKNELLTLDLLNANNWDRPIYFTSIGSTNTLNLDEYFMLEGFAYRLCPYNTGNKSGLIDSELMYNRLMNVMKWGNMNDPNIYIDYTIERTTKILRIRKTFSRLAIQLFREGKPDKAADVMKKCKTIMPYNIYTMTYFDIDFAEAYYTIGDTVSGDEAILEVTKVASQELDFYFSLEDDLFQRMEMEVQMSLETMRRAAAVMMRNNREALFEQLGSKTQNYFKMYEDRGGAVQ
ncbi:MAG: DUF2723 domain-containing protein [Bacteroidales bacterium]|nr:DUF2723 domain-containing protein [Bacteroidales bacterium]HQP03236.1 DUF2723 domain-containing protein [Bacteroidales bacterium]